MKKILINYGVSSDLILCPDRIAENFNDFIGGIQHWIRTNPDGEPYREELFDGEIGCYIDTEVILKYLNTMCIKEGEEKAELYKSNVSKREKAFKVIDF